MTNISLKITNLTLCFDFQLSHVLSGHSARITHIISFESYLVSVDESNTLFAWDLKTKGNQSFSKSDVLF